MASRWITAATEKEDMPKHKRGSMRRIGKPNQVEDKTSMDESDSQDMPMGKKKRGGIVAAMNQPMAY